MWVIVNHADGTESTYNGVVKLPWTHRANLVIDQGAESFTYVPLANIIDWSASKPGTEVLV